MDILNVFGIQSDAAADKNKLLMEFIPVKVWNVERAERVLRPGVPHLENSDNAEIAGPDSVFDHYA
jgi:hypothetical protein